MYDYITEGVEQTEHGIRFSKEIYNDAWHDAKWKYYCTNEKNDYWVDEQAFGGEKRTRSMRLIDYL